MSKRGKKFSFARWIDEWQLTFAAILRAFSSPLFFYVFIASFLIFGTLMNLLSAGSGSFDMISIVDWPRKFEIIYEKMGGLFGYRMQFLDWLLLFSISLVQAILLGSVAVVFKARKDSANLQNAGIAAGLAILGSGCPTCGTTLLMPVVISVFGSSSLALAGTISGILTAASFVIALFALKKVGFEAYVIFEDEDYRRKKAEKALAGSSGGSKSLKTPQVQKKQGPKKKGKK